MTFLKFSVEKTNPYSILFQDEFAGSIAHLCSCKYWKDYDESDCPYCEYGLIISENMKKHRMRFETLEEAKCVFNNIIVFDMALCNKPYVFDSRDSSLREIVDLTNNNFSSFTTDIKNGDLISIRDKMPKEMSQFVLDGHQLVN